MFHLKDTDWLNGLKKQDPDIWCLQETNIRHQLDKFLEIYNVP